jgi:hypothetical protein
MSFLPFVMDGYPAAAASARAWATTSAGIRIESISTASASASAATTFVAHRFSNATSSAALFGGRS